MDVEKIDWEAIGSRLPESDTRLHTPRLPQREFWMLKAGCAALERKMTHQVQSLLVAQIRRLWPEWAQDIAFLAAQNGCSFEEMFVRLAGGGEAQAPAEESKPE